MEGRVPSLRGDFALITTRQRQAWRDAAAWHLTSIMRDQDDKLLPKWKQDEQLEPARLFIKLMREQGVDDLPTIVAHYTSIVEPRPTYARTQ